jgi:hypothetical protein
VIDEAISNVSSGVISDAIRIVISEIAVVIEGLQQGGRRRLGRHAGRDT